MASSACASSPATDAAAKLPTCVDTETSSAESCRADRLGEEQVGGLALGMSMDAVFALLGRPDSATEPVEEAATGDIVTTYMWGAAGVQVDSAQTPADPKQTALRVNVQAPFAGKTLRQIGIGNTEAEARAAYADAIDLDHTRPGEGLVAGSIFGGVIFSFEGGRVTSIFIGAAAE